MIKTNELINVLREDIAFADSLLYPGKQLSEFDSSKLKLSILPSGFPSFDEKFLFKQGRGELIIIGARPSTGKSGLGFQLATNVAKYGKSHIFSLEMDHESIVSRQLAITLNRQLDYVQKIGLDQVDLAYGQSELKKLNCVIDDRSSLNINQIVDAIEMQNKKCKTDLVVIDYIQLVSSSKKEHSKALELAQVSGMLKEIAKKLRIPIIALSQLNRQSEFREDGVPQLSDLKESGSLEQDADIVILLHRPKDTNNKVNAIVAKNRNGPTGDITLEFKPSMCQFIDPKGDELG